MSPERLNSIIASSGLGFWNFKKDQDHYFCPNMPQLLGLDSQEPSWENFVSKIHKDDLESFSESILGTAIKSWELFEEAFNDTVEFRVSHSDQIKHIKCTGNIETDEEGAPVSVVGYLEDITSLKEREMQDLLHLTKMAALGHTATAIVHEINNPLSVLVNYSSALMRIPSASENPETFQRFVEGIFRNSNRISEIVSSVKFFTGGGPEQKFESTSLKTILKETFNLCQENMKWSSIEFEFDCDEDIIVECRPIQISQILINLINNSVMAISCLEERWIKISAEVVSDVVKIFVMDSGRGIPESVVKSLTKPYFTTKKRNEGTGIGLCICKVIAEKHHGRLYYDAASKNTQFVLEIPVKQPVEL